MTVLTIPKASRERLGEEATEGFVEVIRYIDIESKSDLPTKQDFYSLKDDFAKLKDDFAGLKGDFHVHKEETRKELSATRECITRIEGRIDLLQWMNGIEIAGILTLIFKGFFSG